MSIFDRFKALNRQPLATRTQAPPVTNRRLRARRNATRGVTVLIIDDSATVLAVLRKILRSAGYITREAVDAEQGLALLAQAPSDLIFLDIVLPGMNGFHALRAIRKNPTTRHIPVIMISGNEHATEQFYALRIGADNFLKKPFSRYEVFTHIEALLNDHDVPSRRDEKSALTQRPVGGDESQPSLPLLDQHGTPKRPST